MARISSSIGLASGINTSQIIDQLMTIEQQPVQLLQTRIDSANAQKDAYNEISTALTSLKTSTASFRRQSFFQASTVASSDESTLTATATNGAAVGSYQFQVARLVTTQQTVSEGFANVDTAPVGAGTIAVSLGGGDLTNETNLSDLNGGAGVRRGSFRITDRSGASTTIDINNSVSLDDVVKKINTSLDVQVKASIQDDHLVVTDQSGKTASDLIVRDLGDGFAAADLGIVGDSATTAIAGTSIDFVSRKTGLSYINDGRGIRTAATGNDLSIQAGDGGAAVEVSLNGMKSIGDVVDAITTAGGTRFHAEIAPGAKGIRIVDAGGGTISVADVGTSKAAEDLGITGSATGAIAGKSIISGIDTVSLASLNGGTGLALGTISVQSRAASTGTTVDLSGATTLAQVLNTINTANAGVSAAINSAGSGIQITDTSGGSGSLIIGDSSGTGAASLGIAGTFDLNSQVVRGADLKRAWLNQNSLLSNLNGGKGVALGQFKITTKSGVSATIDLTGIANPKLSDVIGAINSHATGVTARINDTGNGIVLEDSTTGAGKLTVEDLSSTTAEDLNIKGADTAGTGKIDGAFVKTITVSATDTLTDVQKKINDLDFGVIASVINDGSPDAPYRLSITSRNSGRSGRAVIDSGTTKLNTKNLVSAQDAAVFYGKSGLTDPLLLTSNKNELAGVIQGVNVSLVNASDKPVTLSISRDSKNVSDELTKFVGTFNDMIDKITSDTKYDTDTQKGGVLLGETTVETVQTTLYQALQTFVPTSGKYRSLADVGLSLDDNAKLQFDSDKFTTAYADDPTGVQALFTTFQSSVGNSSQLRWMNNGAGLRTATSGPDLHITLRDGTAFDVSLNTASTVGDVISEINNASPGKILAKLGEQSNLEIDDLTTGPGALSVQPAGISQAVVDLGIKGVSAAGLIAGSRLTFNDPNVTGAGAGVALDNAITNLTDPVIGSIAAENKTIDDRTQGFQDRIKQLNDLIAAKRTRLETQFANMESVLSGLQSQQQALSSLGSVSTSSAKK